MTPTDLRSQIVPDDLDAFYKLILGLLEVIDYHNKKNQQWYHPLKFFLISCRDLSPDKVMNLAIADLLLLTVIPLKIYLELNLYMPIGDGPLENFLCRYYHCGKHLFMLVSILIRIET